MLSLEYLVVLNTMTDDEERFEQIVYDVNLEPVEFIESPLPECVIRQILIDLIESSDVYVKKDNGRRFVPFDDNEMITAETVSTPSYWYGMTAQGRAKWEPWASE